MVLAQERQIQPVGIDGRAEGGKRREGGHE